MLSCNLSNWQPCCRQRAWATGCVSVPLPTALPSPQELEVLEKTPPNPTTQRRRKTPSSQRTRPTLENTVASIQTQPREGKWHLQGPGSSGNSQPPGAECIRLWKWAAFWIHSFSLLHWDENFVAKNKYTCSNLVGKPLWSNNNNRGITDLSHKPK